MPRDGSLDYPALDDSVRQTIRVILLTRPGEQLLHPEFGVGLEQFLHDPNTITTRRRIRDAIVAGLERWEPRIPSIGSRSSPIPSAPTGSTSRSPTGCAAPASRPPSTSP